MLQRALLLALALGAVEVTIGLEAVHSPTGLKMSIRLRPALYLVSLLCYVPQGTFACCCAAEFSARTASCGIFGACALPC